MPGTPAGEVAPSPAEPVAEPTPGEDTVDAYLAGVEESDALARTDTSNLSPRTNPRVLDHQMQSQDALHRELIELEDARERLRAKREHARLVAEVEREQRRAAADATREDRAIEAARADADDAIERLAAIRAAQREHDPAQAASTLARSRRRDTRGYLFFAVVASALSAVGIGVTVYTRGAPLWAAVVFAVLVETAMTVLASYTISRQAHLDHYRELGRDGQKTRIQADVPSWAANIPVVAIVIVLGFSIAVNAVGAFTTSGIYGALGVAGAVAAALCSVLAWAHSVSASAYIKANLDDHHIQAGMDQLKDRAAGGGFTSLGEATEEDTGHGEDGPDVDWLAERTAQLVAERVAAHLAGGDVPQEMGLTSEDEEFFAALDEQARTALDSGPDGPGGTAVADPDTRGVDAADTPGGGRGVEADASGSEPPTRRGVGAGPAKAAHTPSAASSQRLSEANQTRAGRARRRLREAIDALDAEGIEPTISAVRRRTGMDPRTIRRHWQDVTNPSETTDTKE